MKGLRAVVERMRSRIGARRFNWLSTLLLIGVGSLTVHFLLRDELRSSALLYVGLPYLGAVAITILRPAVPGTRVWRRYLDFSLTSLIVMLGSSIVLFEGFVCVVMFLPIYFLVATACFVFLRLEERAGERGKNLVVVFPLLILASSFEGTTEGLSFERVGHATATMTAELAPEQIMANLVRPIDLDRDRHWLLAVFPMPYRVEAKSLAPGDVHSLHTRYHRWFVANTREGVLRLEILDVEPTRIRTRIVDDTTFYASYLTQIGTEVSLTLVGEGRTEISLRIEYRRNLDPAWYFHPLQQYAMSRMAEFFIEQVMVRSQDGRA